MHWRLPEYSTCARFFPKLPSLGFLLRGGGGVTPEFHSGPLPPSSRENSLGRLRQKAAKAGIARHRISGILYTIWLIPPLNAYVVPGPPNGRSRSASRCPW